jgi:hypothetical protein
MIDPIRASAKAYENRMRRWARRLGYQLCKSREKQWKPDNQLGWMLYTVSPNEIPYGMQYDLSLEQVEVILTDRARERETR